MTSNNDYKPLSFDDDIETAAPVGGSGATNGDFRFVDETNIAVVDQPHLYFCGCCCDFRRAVLTFNAISITLRVFLIVVLFLFGLAVNEDNLDQVEAGIDDDQFKQGLDAIVKSGMFPLFEAVADILWTVGIVFSGIGIYGVLKFKRWAVITSMYFYVFGLVLCAFVLDVLDVIIYGLGVYAHYYMAKLMKEGIMTDENYHKIAGCCGKK